MNTLITNSDPPRLGSQARAAHRGEDKERLAGTWLAFIQFVQGVIIPRCARRTPRHSAAALDDGWRTSGGSDISASGLVAVALPPREKIQQTVTESPLLREYTS